jgi:hypothetical protein
MRVVFLALLLLVACQKDPDTTPHKLATYILVCGAGVQACYTNCGNTYDANRNGTIDASEFYNFKTCTGVCDANCDVSFLYTALSK